jgi:hypothetical protein
MVNCEGRGLSTVFPLFMSFPPYPNLALFRGHLPEPHWAAIKYRTERSVSFQFQVYVLPKRA